MEQRRHDSQNQGIEDLGQQPEACKWHRQFCSDLLKLEFIEWPRAPCVFMKRGGAGMIFLLVHVDDDVVLSSTSTGLKFVIYKLARLFETRVPDSVIGFLGVKVRWMSEPSSESLLLALLQPLYVESVLPRFGLEHSKQVGTPMVD